MANQAGIIPKHQYLVADIGLLDDLKYVRIQNPHNVSDPIKKYILFSCQI